MCHVVDLVLWLVKLCVCLHSNIRISRRASRFSQISINLYCIWQQDQTLKAGYPLVLLSSEFLSFSLVV